MKKRRIVVVTNKRKRKGGKELIMENKSNSDEYLIQNKQKRPIWRLCKRNAGKKMIIIFSIFIYLFSL